MSFAIPVTSEERNGAAKFQPDQLGSLAGEVEKGDGWTDGWTTCDDNTFSGM